MERVQDVAVADGAANRRAAAAERAVVTIELDGAAHDVPAGSTLADLVAALGHASEGVGTAVGGAFVAREQRASRVLQAGDAVLLFQPIVGG
jgi:sulfur carrier protein